MDKRTDYRTEKDSIGEKKVPEDVYYGVQSLRAAENFHITGLNMHPEIINSLAYIKKRLPLPTVRSASWTRIGPLPLSRPAMRSSKGNFTKILSLTPSKAAPARLLI